MPVSEMLVTFTTQDLEKSGVRDIRPDRDDPRRENSRRLRGSLEVDLFVFTVICPSLPENAGAILDFRMIPDRAELYRIGKARARYLGPGEIGALQHRPVEDHRD